MLDKVKKPKKAKKRDLSERRFVASPSAKGKALLGLLFVGAVVLGAGVYARFVSERMPSYATYLVAGGAILIAIYILIVPEDAYPLLVGDAGVGEEHGEGAKRIPWCDVTAITRDGGTLVLSTESSGQVRVSLDQHLPAAGRILAEMDERLADHLSIDQAVRQGVPPPDDKDGEVRKVSGVQVAGRRCKASGKVLSFEDDARGCPRCGEVYHHSAVPELCLTCGGGIPS